MEKATPQSGKTGYGLGYTTEKITTPVIIAQGHTGGYPGSFTFWYYLPETDTYLTYNVNYLGSMQEVVQKMKTCPCRCPYDWPGDSEQHCRRLHAGHLHEIGDDLFQALCSRLRITLIGYFRELSCCTSKMPRFVLVPPMSPARIKWLSPENRLKFVDISRRYSR